MCRLRLELSQEAQHGFRVFRQGRGAAGEASRLHGRPHLSKRGALRRGDRHRRPLATERDHGEAQGQGEGRWAVEPVPAGVRARRRAEQSRIRAALRDHGPLAAGAGGVQLLGARHGQHGGDRALRHGGAEAGMAGAAARGPDPLMLRHDRAGRSLVRRHQHRQHDQARGRPLRHQRPQMVGHRCARSALQDRHLHGPDRPG